MCSLGTGNGPYDDQYLIVNLTSHIESGWYDDVSYGWLPMLGFQLGMIHGGMIDPATHELRMSASLVILADPDFSKGYWVGRDYYFFEAPPEEQHPTDTWLISRYISFCLSFHMLQRGVEFPL